MLSFARIVVPLSTAALCIMVQIRMSFLFIHFLRKLPNCPHFAKVHSMECSQGVHNGHLSDYTLPEELTLTAKAFQLLMGFQHTESGYN